MCREGSEIIALVMYLLLVVCNCSTDTVTGGTSTSENGRVAGRIVTDDGIPAPNTQVVLIPADYNPLSDAVLPADTTDSLGAYLFTDVDTGDYTVQSIHINMRTRSFSQGIHVAGDTITLIDDTLEKTGTIRIALPDSIDASEGYVYIPGTTISARVLGDGLFAILDSVPAGTMPSVVYAPSITEKGSVVYANVKVEPHDTATVLASGWKYQRTLRLNTSSTGADINETLYRFPVLLRLTEREIDFDEVQPDGADLLFTKKDNATLPYEIERWDAAGHRAEVWIRVDTLPGGDSTFLVIMHWGNQRVTTPTFTTGAVFDTAAGFGGVWHLDDGGDTLHDVTQNQYHGIRYGSVTASEGLIGTGQVFDTTEAYCEMGNVLNPGTGSFTVSAWVKRDTTGLQTIFAKSNGGMPELSYGWSLSFDYADEPHCFIATGGTMWNSAGAYHFWAPAEVAVTDTSVWHYVVAIIDRSSSPEGRVYLDGVEVTGQTIGDITSIGELVNTLPLRIGAEADGEYQWTGMIDECIIATTVRSADWIRLCYLNQDATDRLVEYIESIE